MSSELTALTQDPRQQQLEQWLAQHIDIDGPGVAAGSDASCRRYFRYHSAGKTLIAMDAPPAELDCRPFVKVAAMLAAAGVSVPTIMAEDLQQGFLLISDLGKQTYLETMQQPGFSLEQAEPLFTEAMDALIKFQLTSKPGSLPVYDEAFLRRELELFSDWYLQRHLTVVIDGELQERLDNLYQTLIEQALSQPQVFVHRDYMPRNLMVNNHDDRGVGVLDFQDALFGPISYDITCLFKDAFISWPEEKVQQWLHDYWQSALQAGLPVANDFADFQRDCDYMGVQRHLKVMGIFARICYRDGKPEYLKDAPRFMNYLQSVADRRPELEDLQALLNADFMQRTT